jgi:hypothetical protein
MKKLLAIVLVLAVVGGVIVVGVIVAGYFVWRSQQASKPRAELRAYMQDEDADLPSRPSVALTVNGSEEPLVVSNAPLLLTVGVTNPRALERAASLQSLADKIKNLSALPQTPGTTKRLKLASDDYQQRLHAPPLTLGDAGHAWSDSLQVLVRTGSTEAPLPFPVRVLQPAVAGAVSVGATSSVDVTYGSAAASFAPGSYILVACLSATGTWKGKSCSEPVKIAVVADAAQLTPEQQEAIDEQNARYALVTADWARLEQIAQALTARDAVAGHVYLGDAKYGQKKWEEALAEYTAARRELALRSPDRLEAPRYLNARIIELIAIVYQGQ